MHPRRRRRLLLILGLLAGVGSTTALVLYALGQNLNLFYLPHQIRQGEAPQNQVIRVGGLVVEQSVRRDPDSLKVYFDLSDSQGGRITVQFEGILPDLFREGQGIVARGKLHDDGLIHAAEVLAKHDENYMPSELAAELGKSHDRALANPAVTANN